MAIFARAPSPGRTKTRLIPLLGARGAAKLQVALIADALHRAGTLAERASRYLFLAGRSISFLSPLSSYTLVRQRGLGLGKRLERAFRQLLHRHKAVVVIGTDSPTLPPRVLREAFEELRVCDAVLGPCPDGGYYLIGLRRLSPGVLRGVRWGSRFAFRDTSRNLLRHGYACSILEPFADIDRPQDFRRLEMEMLRSPAVRRLAPCVWRFIKARRRLGRSPNPSARTGPRGRASK